MSDDFEQEVLSDTKPKLESIDDIQIEIDDEAKEQDAQFAEEQGTSTPQVDPAVIANMYGGMLTGIMNMTFERFGADALSEAESKTFIDSFEEVLPYYVSVSGNPKTVATINFGMACAMIASGRIGQLKKPVKKTKGEGGNVTSMEDYIASAESDE